MEKDDEDWSNAQEQEDWWNRGGEGGRQWEPHRAGVNGGRVRNGSRGGTNRDYYALLHRIKHAKGDGVMHQFASDYGVQGKGLAYRPRKEQEHSVTKRARRSGPG